MILNYIYFLTDFTLSLSFELSSISMGLYTTFSLFIDELEDMWVFLITIVNKIAMGITDQVPL